MTALNLLNEIGSRAPMEMCMDLIENRAETDELADVAAELLTNLGRVVVEPVLQRMERSSRDAKETFLDVLCNFPGDERIYNYAESAFRNRPSGGRCSPAIWPNWATSAPLKFCAPPFNMWIWAIWIILKSATPSRPWAARWRRNGNFSGIRITNP